MSSTLQVECPGCGVSISPAQGRCAFCLRSAEAVRASRRRWALVAILVGAATLLVAGAVLVRHRTRGLVTSRPAPSIVPVFEPTLVRHVVQITESTLSLDGQAVLETRPLFEEHRAMLAEAEPVPSAAASPSAQLARALRLAYERPGFTRDRLVIEATSGVPLAVVIETITAAGDAGFATKSVTVPASAGLPPATFYTVVKTPGKKRRDALFVQFNHFSIDMELDDAVRRRAVGEACTLDAGGLTLRYAAEPDFSATLACLTALRARLPPAEPANAVLQGRAETPIGSFVHVANAMRCGKPDCPERPTRLWDEFSFQTMSGRFAPAVKELVGRSEPSLVECYEAQRAELTRPAYEVEGWVWFTKGRPPRVELEPGLPALLQACAERALQRERIAELSGADPKRAYYIQLMIHGRDLRPTW